VNRLSKTRLDSLPHDVRRPLYDLDSLQVGVVHLGVGASHRAHQAVFFDDRLAAGETAWAICGASLRSAGTRDALQPQDGLCTSPREDLAARISPSSARSARSSSRPKTRSACLRR
jgi:fructuronate reductase